MWKTSSLHGPLQARYDGQHQYSMGVASIAHTKIQSSSFFEKLSLRAVLIKLFHIFRCWYFLFRKTCFENKEKTTRAHDDRGLELESSGRCVFRPQANEHHVPITVGWQVHILRFLYSCTHERQLARHALNASTRTSKCERAVFKKMDRYMLHDNNDQKCN